MAGYELTEGFSDSSFFNVDISNLRVDGGKLQPEVHLRSVTDTSIT